MFNFAHSSLHRVTCDRNFYHSDHTVDQTFARISDLKFNLVRILSTAVPDPTLSIVDDLYLAFLVLFHSNVSPVGTAFRF